MKNLQQKLLKVLHIIYQMEKRNIIGTTDENGNLKIKNLYVEKEYKINKN